MARMLCSARSTVFFIRFTSRSLLWCAVTTAQKEMSCQLH